MANYYCKTRTNYFSVTDLEKFKQIIASCIGEEEIVIIDEEQEDGSIKYGFYCEGSVEGLPEKEDGTDNTEDFDEYDYDYNYDAFCEALQQILPDNDVIIITEVGSEKMRYLTGLCSVITRNEYKCINITDEAVKLARILLNNPAFTTQMDY